ncbi:hypothetical protein [Amycolatopsis echigonensis]|uniref:Uncharacterized protein n=1 Tax=Amycolatopsis echigonensis TaxID=2576905 RepID=A0A8E1VTH4_9PSEU|nr:hypothetical protein [Amycolatopsis echigonensis]MBB2497858.1 hypothetical protein [Amycolatopsis echigonensis]
MVYAVVGGWLALAALVVAAWRRMGQDRRWRVAVLLFVLGFSLLHQLLFATATEDAYVSFRYAQNIADGNGPVFNMGDRSETYANFLWLVVIALPRGAFGAEVPTAAVVLSCAAALGCVLTAYFLANRIAALGLPEGVEPRRAIGVAAALLTAGANGLAVYGLSGTELPMFSLLVLCVAYALVAGRPLVAGVLVASAVMTRPEGLVLAVVGAVWLVSAAVRGRHTWWAPVGFVLGALVFLVPWTAWRVTYYDRFVPAAELPPGPDWPYLGGFALAHLGFLVPAAVVAGLVAARGRSVEARSALWLLLALAIGHAGIVLFFEKDPGLSWRLLVPVPPLLAVAAVAGCGVLTPVPRPRAVSRAVPAVTAALTGIAVAVSVFSPEVLERVRAWSTQGAQLAEVGDWLARYLPPGSVVSAGSPGLLASRAGSKVLVVGLDAERSTLAVPGRSGYASRQDCADDLPAWYRVATFRRIGTPFWISVYPRADDASQLVDELDRAPDFHYVSCP